MEEVNTVSSAAKETAAVARELQGLHHHGPYWHRTNTRGTYFHNGMMSRSNLSIAYQYTHIL